MCKNKDNHLSEVLMFTCDIFDSESQKWGGSLSTIATGLFRNDMDESVNVFIDCKKVAKNKYVG